MSNTMPSPDAALKDFFKSNDVFAGLFNAYFYENKKIVDPNDLVAEDSSYTACVKVGFKGKQKPKMVTKTINRYRDNIRKTSIGYLVILGIEDQNKIHYSMPVRKQLYDALGYTSELTALGEIQNRTNWTVDESLSRVKKSTKITPIITVVFYTGEKPWDGPRSLHEMMNIDELAKPIVPDYPLYVIDIGHDEDLLFDNKELEELRIMLSSVYSNTGDNNETLIDKSIIALTGILANDEKLYYSAANTKGGKIKVCQALQERDERIKSEYEIKIAEKDAEIEEINAMHASMLAKKEAEIAELKRLLASKQ